MQWGLHLILMDMPQHSAFIIHFFPPFFFFFTLFYVITSLNPPQEALTFLALSDTESFGKWKLSFPAMASMVQGLDECPVFSKPHKTDCFCGGFWGRRGQMVSARCRDMETGGSAGRLRNYERKKSQGKNKEELRFMSQIISGFVTILQGYTVLCYLS